MGYAVYAHRPPFYPSRLNIDLSNMVGLRKRITDYDRVPHGTPGGGTTPTQSRRSQAMAVSQSTGRVIPMAEAHAEIMYGQKSLDIN